MRVTVFLLAGMILMMVLTAQFFSCKGISVAAKKEIEITVVSDTQKKYPIAAGIYYPTDEKLPEAPMRYYRVRCWPGCHSGSSYGKYPDRQLHEKPIFMTSTIDNLAAE
ncbi:MAG: hypothetical protein AB1798_02375 [Spirochaetota bacterium]